MAETKIVKMRYETFKLFPKYEDSNNGQGFLSTGNEMFGEGDSLDNNFWHESKDFGFFITFYLIWVLVVGTLFCIAAGLPGGGWDMDYVFIMTSWLIAPLGLHFTIQGLISNKKLIFLGLGVLAPFMFLVVGYYVDYFIGLAKPKEPICFLGGKKVDCEEQNKCFEQYGVDECLRIHRGQHKKDSK